MRITITKEITPKSNPDLAGEYLRNAFFDQDNGEFGCYSTFKTREDVVSFPDEEIEDCEEDDIRYHVFQKVVNDEIVKMRYFWDGDGVLEFHFQNDSYIQNGDCKKSYGWKYFKP